MELAATILCVVCSFILSANLIFCSTASLETDRMALFTFKGGISSDPLGALSSWNRTLHLCEWKGVRCGRRHKRVTVLDLSGQQVEGSISPAISNLSFLREIHLQENSFSGQIPQEISRLFRLSHLNMSYNLLGGHVPVNLTRCSNLIVIDLEDNQLTGKIPEELSTLSKLLWLNLKTNDITGRIPPSLGNLSSLTHLVLMENNLEGSIPDAITRIEGLEYFDLSLNKLSGTVPPSLYNVSSIKVIAMTGNQLYGSLPSNIGLFLPNLQHILLADNQFTGRFPESLSNASRLKMLNFAMNNFTGPMPANLGSLVYLQRLGVWGNQLGTGKDDDLGFITSLTNCSHLTLLVARQNRFGGVLPRSIVNLSTQLRILSLGHNQIVGSIPSQIGNLFNLQILSLGFNNITGTIPDSIGNLTQLSQLGLGQNNLQGSIPSTLGNCQNLTLLMLAQNNLNGTIPKEVICLSSLPKLPNPSQNSLPGYLPWEVSYSDKLGMLDVSENKLSGEIPITLGKCQTLAELYMQGNKFEGTIPPFFSSLTAIEVLDLSNNNFSGNIPNYLQGFHSLTYLNLSFNNLEGEVPKQGIFRDASAFSVIGNDNLCGGIPKLQLPACPILANEKQEKSLVSRVIIPIMSSALCLIFLLCSIFALYWIRNSRKKPSPTSSMDGRHLKVSYAELFEATDGFSSANLIGAGSYGSVYKGILGPDENVVAVKVFNLQLRRSSKSFMAECEALRNIRHRNLVKIITCCSSIDFRGNDFKALVFELMKNGSLEKWLHPKMNRQRRLNHLNFIKRLNIAIDVASALDYLHHHCHMPIAHCDLKPGNILLDEDMNAHVADFGLARFHSRIVPESSKEQSSTIGLKGTIGYIAPEYGTGGRVSMEGDVYSFGILLLEIFTGKRPIDDMFKDGLTLHKFVETALPERQMEVVDPLLLKDEEERATSSAGNDGDKISRLQECLTSILRIGVVCSAESPRERMEMGDVAKEMNVIRDIYLAVRIQGERRNRVSLLGEGPSYFSNSNLTRCMDLLAIDFNYNKLTGKIPEELSTLPKLFWLNLNVNDITGQIPPSLGNISSHTLLSLNRNHLEGSIPDTITQIESLKYLILYTNNLSGMVPPSLYNLSSNEIIELTDNLLYGTLPPDMGVFVPNIQGLYLGQNLFGGRIPVSLSNASQLNSLDLDANYLIGSVPVNPGNLKNLELLNIWGNQLGAGKEDDLGFITSLTNCSHLRTLDASINGFGGVLPRSIVNLSTELSFLATGQNQIVGSIPSQIRNLFNLQSFGLEVNFTTAIDAHDLSINNFSGKIPKYLETFQFLKYLNLSFNNLEGEVPKQGIFRNASAILVIGNDNLCGGIPELHLPACPIPAKRKQRKSAVSRVISSTLCLIFLLCVIAALYWIRNSRKKPSHTSTMEGQLLKVSFPELFKATDGFSPANLIGTGTYGSVYKGILGPDENVIAVKVRNLQLRRASKSFMAECEALRNIRHRNLVKIITSCSSMDFSGNDFKALVFEFMPNGSLEKWLHLNMNRQHQLNSLNFIKRLNIAIDVASALDYLHHHYHMPISHCDLKPSNILLDEDMNAHVGDFGLARFQSRIVHNASNNQSNTIGLKGTIGYIAPEYGTGGHVSVEGDVYRFGILLLEIFTGKSPTDDMFKDGLTLHKFAEMALLEQLIEIVNLLLLLEDEEERATTSARNGRDKISRFHECLMSILRIGVVCSAESPRERMKMGDVVKEMNVIRDIYLGVRIQGERRNIGDGPSHLSNY
ncbi:putative receptor-like protein kinase At3g47110 [Tasmannia lanceolata]|uniref:putative receptor-like protein kinase At3g47110 n=1 Tax=Tasmannia lanceolata TaxID=3420 RepID=UPI0040643A0A